MFRHTFTTHFMSNGGNILVLQKILGHRSISNTMIYRYFFPDHLVGEVQFNPLAT
ncbi:hypothetical protein ES150_13390 [Enterobacillus tribolii]|nr:hypothetical protein [Enterobacillus tribolii]